MRLFALLLFTWPLLFQVNRRAEIKKIEGTTIAFVVDNAGIPVSGTLTCTSAAVNVNVNDLSQFAIKATADPKTIHTGIAMRDQHLRKQDYFDTDHYPMIKLESIGFKKSGKNKITGTFDLTIKNIRKTIDIPIKLHSKGNKTLLSGTFEINRLDFGLGEKSIVLNERVRIVLEAEIEQSEN